MIKPLLLYVLLITSISCWCQDDEPVSNSFERIYKKSNPLLQYSYDSATQTHNYSGNWDFDADGRKDQLFFIGTGGAHLYYYLRIILSSDNRVQNFTFLESDFPVVKTAEGSGFNPIETFTPFAVADFNGDSIDDIFLHIDRQTLIDNPGLKRHGVTKETILITFKGRRTTLKNYVP